MLSIEPRDRGAMEERHESEWYLWRRGNFAWDDISTHISTYLYFLAKVPTVSALFFSREEALTTTVGESRENPKSSERVKHN